MYFVSVISLSPKIIWEWKRKLPVEITNHWKNAVYLNLKLSHKNDIFGVRENCHIWRCAKINLRADEVGGNLYKRVDYFVER